MFFEQGEILYKRSAHNAAEYVWVLRKSAQGRPYFCYACKWNYIYTCAVKPYDTLTVKNAMAKPVYCFKAYTICNLFT
jgi:hypothetical protein